MRSLDDIARTLGDGHMCERTGHPGVLDIWELGRPLLRGEYQVEDVMWKSERPRRLRAAIGAFSLTMAADYFGAVERT
jgi:hypothetical protein